MDLSDTPYYKQTDLLLQVLPIIAKFDDFALKGGTAINLFIRDLPRLSVDIDLTYLPLDDRNTALLNISSHLIQISEECQAMFNDCQISTKKYMGNLYALTVTHNGTSIKIEPNTTIRGVVFPSETLKLCSKAQDMFGRSIDIRTLSFEDLYGGKLCAALDRQHPRDLYDIYHLYRNEGITDKTRQAFIVYLLSHNRPIAELLDPQLKSDLGETFQESFEGMAFDPVPLDDLVKTWKMTIQKLNNDFNEEEREFILSFKRKSPEWDLFPVKEIRHLPAVQWKMMNLKRMSSKKHTEACEKLERVLRS